MGRYAGTGNGRRQQLESWRLVTRDILLVLAIGVLLAVVVIKVVVWVIVAAFVKNAAVLLGY